MKTNDQESKSSQNRKEAEKNPQPCKMYSESNVVDLGRAFHARGSERTLKGPSTCSSTNSFSDETTITFNFTEPQSEKISDNSLCTMLNMVGKSRLSVRERRRNTLPTLPVWEPRYEKSRKTLSLTKLDETEIINGTLTTTLCSTEL